MRKVIPFLLLLYLLTFVGAGLYGLLKPPPPPKPPGAWELTWREHGNVVAIATITMLSMIQIAIGLFFLGGVLVLLKKGWTIWSHTVGRSGGLAPVIRDKNGEWLDPNPEGAVIAAAIAAHAPRVTAGMAKNMMGVALDRGPRSVQDTTYQDAPVLDASYRVVEEFRPDMVNATGHGAQHHIFVGPTGSGKSVAAYSILDEMKRQQPDAEFYIFEPGGVEWKNQAAVTDFEGLFDLVRYFHDEMRRRQALLAAHPEAVHAFQLGLPPVILFVEEAGAALDHYKLSPGGKKRANEFLLYLRNLLREGRKAGIGVVLVDQSAMAETVDTQVLDNVSDVWILTKGVSPRLLRRWGLTDEFRKLQQAGLIQDRPGLAYSYHKRNLVQFPLRDRPMLTAKSPTLKRENVTRTADASPSSPPVPKSPVRPSVPVRKSAVRYALPPTRRSDGTLNDDGVTLARRNVITPAAAQRVYEAYLRSGRSYTGAQRKLFPDQETGGYWFYWIRDVVEQLEGRPRSRPTVTIEDRSVRSGPGRGRGAGNGRSYHRAVRAPSSGTGSADAAVRRLAEESARRVPYPVASHVLKLYRRFDSVEAVHRHLWPGQAVDARRVAWLERVVEQMLRGRPDSYGPVVVVGWPDA